MPTWTAVEIFAEIVRRCSRDERLALCTVVRTRGSCPQGAGAKMLVLGDGKTLSTLGGGCIEAEVRQRAMQMLIDDRSGLLSFTLDHDYGWDDGLICGGAMDIFVQSLDADRAAPFASLLEASRNGSSDALRIAYEREGKQEEYVEPIEPPPALLIIGAGHVSQAVAQLAPGLGFEVSVVDDRADFLTAERFPTAKHRIAGEIEPAIEKFPIDARTFVIIVTRGHQHDGAALAAVINSPAKYIGMIGSKRKVKTIFADLAASGVPFEKLARVHAPIGFDIGAVSVQEIAISIAAELVAVLRGQKEGPARSMKMDETQLKAWINRGED